MNVYILIIDINIITLTYDISEFNLNNCIREKNIISKKYLYILAQVFSCNTGKLYYILKYHE